MVLVSTVLITFSSHVTKLNVLIGAQDFCCQDKLKWLQPPDVFLLANFWPARLGGTRVLILPGNQSHEIPKRGDPHFHMTPVLCTSWIKKRNSRK